VRIEGSSAFDFVASPKRCPNCDAYFEDDRFVCYGVPKDQLLENATAHWQAHLTS
jgi:hypothetical protein